MSDHGSKLRWKIADTLNRRQDTCWLDLVAWVLGWRGLSETRINENCRRDLARNGCCYCGKLRAPKAGDEQ